MIKRYQSNYSNEVHQLIVSPSKHYYVTNSGIFKYQKKPFEIKLENIEQAKKIHTIHYLLRDHFSGLFYWEICSSNALIPIYAFLFRAWIKKQCHPLYGIPDFMTVPKNVQSYFPGLLGFIEKIGVTYIKVTSGFQGGVRDIRTIEDELRLAGFDYVNPHLSQKEPPFDLVLGRAPEICRRFSDSLYRKPSKKEAWLSGLESEERINVPKRLKTFEESYLSTQQKR
jgi:hypothetical protein